MYPLFGKHSVFHRFIFISVYSGTSSQVSQAWLLPCYPLCRLIQQVLFYHQTCSYLLLHFPLPFLYTEWGFDKENSFLFSCTTSLSSRKIKTFITMMLSLQILFTAWMKQAAFLLHQLDVDRSLNKEVEAETGTLVCKQRQDNTTVPHNQWVVDKQEHVWKTLPQTLHQHNLVVLKHKRWYCQISNYSQQDNSWITVYPGPWKLYWKCTLVINIVTEIMFSVSLGDLAGIQRVLCF